MTRRLIGFINIMIIALMAGTVFGIWLGYNPAEYSSSTFVEQQQAAIRALNVTLPVLGAIAILLTIISAYLARASSNTLYLLLTTILFLLVAALVTRFGNQPINAIVITWSIQAPPENWTTLRDSWWQWHIIRTLAMIAALSLILLANPMQKR